MGTFLIRLWAVTKDPHVLVTAKGAAVAARQVVWELPPVQWHGVARVVELLMDMAEATGEGRYVDWAMESVSALRARATCIDGLMLTSGLHGTAISPAWGTGTAGVVAALL
ncbi:hypothetical protein GCM10014715_86810 [Streptomyces spiralis]|uniref:Uncharacterized protein n=1 Tax=Streptomyces spiralis TaxID=66376 RepID=A0A919APE6_9ACTN|nr:hypothetical protein [Streptomyces spiralis]GHF18528.1 hypothetical protein GCM10014715_86810 [Streptomyces spiralis]